MLNVRKAEKEDFKAIVDYFMRADAAFLQLMGVDAAKLPERSVWINMLSDDFDLQIDDKRFFYVIWLDGETPVGHSNINKIVYAQEAYMHLHIWNPEKRKKGTGAELVKESLNLYFDLFQLKTLYCEPNALNPAPNQTLKKLGFELIKTYETTPGFINFYQTVNRWSLSENQYKRLYGVSVVETVKPTAQ